MKIKMLSTAAGPHGIFKSGQEVEVPDAQGRAFLATTPPAAVLLSGEPAPATLRARKQRAGMQRVVNASADTAEPDDADLVDDTDDELGEPEPASGNEGSATIPALEKFAPGAHNLPPRKRV